MPAVSTLLRPELNDIPIVSEISVCGNPVDKLLINAGDPDQFSQVMGVARLHLSLVREFPSAWALGDASLSAHSTA